MAKTKENKMIEEIEDAIQKEMNHILCEDIPFMREHKFKMEEEALRYKYDGLETARSILWRVTHKYGF